MIWCYCSSLNDLACDWIDTRSPAPAIAEKLGLIQNVGSQDVYSDSTQSYFFTHRTFYGSRDRVGVRADYNHHLLAQFERAELEIVCYQISASYSMVASVVSSIMIGLIR